MRFPVDSSTCLQAETKRWCRSRQRYPPSPLQSARGEFLSHGHKYPRKRRGCEPERRSVLYPGEVLFVEVFIPRRRRQLFIPVLKQAMFCLYRNATVHDANGNSRRRSQPEKRGKSPVPVIHAVTARWRGDVPRRHVDRQAHPTRICFAQAGAKHRSVAGEPVQHQQHTRSTLSRRESHASRLCLQRWRQVNACAVF